ncbi:carboxypeptidase-like regulatory domain-containing protein [Mucilaginibacter auburnensis]|uniref:carboxypeptidase-like regulatory domain-containing protein n=1 Tax=Mucilaginibacter auburnensis TaxID=1457233 RepID=UPI0012FD4765|nr:carboxypeptidase-like regulatory domain-containing protein [Mucilaginibacter auburnensis]
MSLKQAVETISAYNQANTPDKIFVHTDKWNYNKEDTLWFKSYILNATTMASSTKSGVMYLEISDGENHIITRNMVAVKNGSGSGYIPLNNRFLGGTYILRAYTNWNRNFGDKYVFTRQFFINDLEDAVWRVNSRFDIVKNAASDKLMANLTFLRNDGLGPIGEELNTRVSWAGSNFYRAKITPTPNGEANFAFDLPPEADLKEISINLTKKNKKGADVTLNIPVIANRDDKLSVQFMPEGGNILAGLVNKVAFKVLNEQGYGVDIEGGVYNNNNELVAQMSSTHKGMGTFYLNALNNETYTARITYRGVKLNFTLPAVKPSGIMLQVDNIRSADSLTVYVAPTQDVQHTGESYYLIGQSRGGNCYGAVVNSGNGAVRIKISKKIFLTGVAKLTLFNTTMQPLATRAFFIDHHDVINFSVTPTAGHHTWGDSVSIKVKASDKDGRPVSGNFSVAITSNNLVEQDSTGISNLNVKLLLNDDLQGNVENPGWYFSAGDERLKAMALDNLLLTQGWTNYNWQVVFQPLKKPEFEPEPEFAVKGRVKTMFNKPIPHTGIVLMSTKPIIVTDTTSNDKGEFMFTDLYPVDTMTFKLQARNLKGKSSNVKLEVDEFVPPVFTLPQQRIIPWYVNIDTARSSAIREGRLQTEENIKVSGQQLKEVQVKAKKVVSGSKGLLAPGEADLIFTAEDIQKMGRVSLGDILLDHVPGLRYGLPKAANRNSYNMNQSTSMVVDIPSVFDTEGPGYNLRNVPTYFIVDGVSTLETTSAGINYANYIRTIFHYLQADDIKGIEVITSYANQNTYVNKYIRRHNPMAKAKDYTFVEITTYSGNGLFTRTTVGTYTYRPLVFAPKKEFYVPKYNVKNSSQGIDARPTIYWNPDVVTDENGNAEIVFYTTGKRNDLHIAIQGADMFGKLGSAGIKIMIPD